MLEYIVTQQSSWIILVQKCPKMQQLARIVLVQCETNIRPTNFMEQSSRREFDTAQLIRIEIPFTEPRGSHHHSTKPCPA